MTTDRQRLDRIADMCNEFVVAVHLAGNVTPDGQPAPALTKRAVLRAVNVIYRVAIGAEDEPTADPTAGSAGRTDPTPDPPYPQRQLDRG